MSHGRGIRLFLVDGTPNGLLTAEIMNWTGHALTSPRTKLTELVKRAECGRTGVYFLVGPDPENAMRPVVYIGESDDVAKRLKQHNRPESQGGKDFWERVCLITSKDQNLTKAHVKYLESRLMAVAKQSGRCGLVNGTAHEYTVLPESDQADMAFFIEQIRILLPVLGFDFLREPVATHTGPSVQSDIVFEMNLPTYEVSATAREIEGQFVILKGSEARPKWTAKPNGYGNLYDQLVKDGVLTETQNNKRLFANDFEFNSPSAAAAIVAGRNTNGRTKWQVKGRQENYGEWQSAIVDAQSAIGDPAFD